MTLKRSLIAMSVLLGAFLGAATPGHASVQTYAYQVGMYPNGFAMGNTYRCFTSNAIAFPSGPRFYVEQFEDQNDPDAPIGPIGGGTYHVSGTSSPVASGGPGTGNPGICAIYGAFYTLPNCGRNHTVEGGLTGYRTPITCSGAY